MVRQPIRNKNISCALSLAFILSSGHLFGASFQSFNQSASSLGFAHADMGSLAEDATTNWYNPAGITRFSTPQATVGVANVHFDTYVNPFIDFNPELSGQDLANAIIYYGPVLVFTNLFGGGSANTFDVPRSKGNTNQIYGYAHYVHPFQTKIGCLDAAIGLSLTSPWNWQSDYSCTDVVSYAKRTQINSFAIAPTLAIRAFKKISIAFQPRFERFSWYQSSELARLWGVNYYLRNWFCSYNASALYQFNDYLRLGATYEFNHVQTLQGNGNILTTNYKAKTTIHLPDLLTLGFTWDPGSSVAITGTIVYTNWSRFKTIDMKVERQSGKTEILSSIPYHFKDTYLTAIGLRYLASERFTLRTGLNFETPATRNAYREIKFHDAKKYSLGLGLNYAFNCHLSFDFGYRFTYSPTNELRENSLTDNDPNLLVNEILYDIPPTPSPELALYYGSAKTLIHTFGLQFNGRF